MQSFKKNITLIVGQIVFFILFFRYFLRYSFLRPHAEIWTECVIAILLIATMAINFWILFPLIYKKYSFFTYMVTSVY